MSRSINLAVIPGDGIGQEVVAEGLKVLSAVLPQDVKLETKEYDLGARRYHATGETLTDADLDAAQGARRDPARRHRRPVGPVRRARARAAAQAALRLRPPRQPAPVASSSRACDRRSPAARRSTSSSSARAPRARTPATAAPCARAPPHEVATEVSLNTAFGVERVVRDAFARAAGPPAQEAHAGPQEQRARARRPPVDERIFDEVGRGVPRGHHRLPARRRRDDLPRHRSPSGST